MGDLMKEDNKTKQQLIHELTELRSQNAALKKSITGSISAALAAEEASRYAESVVETVREPLLVLDADLKIISANRNFYRAFKVTPGETIGTFIYDLGNKQWDIPELRELLEEVLPEKQAFDDFEVAHNFQDIGHKNMLLNAREIYRKDIGAKMILLAIEDITVRKRAEDALRESEKGYRELSTKLRDAYLWMREKKDKSEAQKYSESIIFLTEDDGQICGFTEEAVGITKKSHSDIQGCNIQDILVSQDGQTFMDLIHKVRPRMSHLTALKFKNQMEDGPVYVAKLTSIVVESKRLFYIDLY